MMRIKNVFLSHKDIIYITIIVILISLLPLSYEYIVTIGRRQGMLTQEYYSLKSDVSNGENLLYALKALTTDLNGDKRDETIEKLNNIVREFPASINLVTIISSTEEYLNPNNNKELKDIIKYWEDTTLNWRMNRLRELNEIYFINRELAYIIPIIILLFAVPIAFKVGLNIGRTRS